MPRDGYRRPVETKLAVANRLVVRNDTMGAPATHAAVTGIPAVLTSPRQVLAPAWPTCRRHPASLASMPRWPDAWGMPLSS